MSIDYNLNWTDPTLRTVTAGSLIIGGIYKIISLGTTDFTFVGGVNTVGATFIAGAPWLTGPDPTTGTTGTAYFEGIKIPQGSTNQETSVTFTGKGALNWGEELQQSMMSIMENFAGPTGPANATVGQVWFDGSNLNVYGVTGPTGPWNQLLLTETAVLEFAPMGGVITPFTVSGPFSVNDAVNRGFTDATYAPIGGVTTPFTVSGPFGANDAINLAYANANYLTIVGGIPIREEIKSVFANVTDVPNCVHFGLDGTIIPQYVDFRSTTAANGHAVTLGTASVIDAVIPYTATLGVPSGVYNRFIIAAIDVAGVMEVAVRNTFNGSQLDESQMISTTALSGTNAVTALGSLVSSSLYTPGTYGPGIPLLDQSGTGSGATATFTVGNLSSGQSTITFSPTLAPTSPLGIETGSYTFEVTVDGGFPVIYTVSLTGGGVTAHGTLGGVTSGYTPGTYTGVALTYITAPTLPLVGGSGAIATVVVAAGGAISTVTITSAGSGYGVGDILTGVIPGNTGLHIPVSAVSGGDTMNSVVGLMNTQLAGAASTAATASGFKITSPTSGTNSKIIISTSGMTLINAISTSITGSFTNVQVDGITGVTSATVDLSGVNNPGGRSYAIGNVLYATGLSELTVPAVSITQGVTYTILTLGTSDYTTSGATTVNAGSLVIGNSYVIKTLGTSNFVTAGAASNTVGTSFIATTTGAGTGTVYNAAFTATAGNSGTGTVGSRFTVKVASVNAGSNTAETWYSRTARSNVPFRIIGYFDDPGEATAGNWISTPSIVQGAGGNAIYSGAPIVIPGATAAVSTPPNVYVSDNPAGGFGPDGACGTTYYWIYRYTIQQTGTYEVYYVLVNGQHATHAQIYRNGVAYGPNDYNGGPGYTGAGFAHNLYFNAGDIVDLYSASYSGGDYHYCNSYVAGFNFYVNSYTLRTPPVFGGSALA
jgi:hypothetical protein